MAISATVNLETLSEISRDIGQIFFAAMVVGQLASPAQIDWQMFIWGMIASLISWIMSLIINK